MINFVKGLFGANEEVEESVDIKKVEDSLAKELRENSGTYFYAWRSQILIIHILRFCLEKDFDVSLKDEDIYNTFLEVYRLGMDITDLSLFEEVLETHRKDIIKNKLGYKPQFSKNFTPKQLLNKGCEMTKEERNLAYPSSVNERAFILPQIDLFDDRVRQCEIICRIYYLIEGMVQSIVAYRSHRAIINNKEFCSIIYNASKESFCDEELKNKMWEMYENYYSDLLPLDYYQFGNLFLLLWFKIAFNLDNNVNKDNTFDYQTALNIIMGDEFREGAGYEYAYVKHLSTCVESHSPSEIFNFLLKLSDVSDDVKQLFKARDLENEKNRLIIGDSSEQKSLELEKLEFSNVRSGIEFEEYLEYLFTKLGYETEGTKATGDQGADLIIHKDGIKTVVQAKFYSSKVGNKAVQEVVSAIAYYQADEGMVVTNNYYTPSAIDLANANNITLVDKDGLDEMILEASEKHLVHLSSKANELRSKFYSQEFPIGLCHYFDTITDEVIPVNLTLHGHYICMEGVLPENPLPEEKRQLFCGREKRDCEYLKEMTLSNGNKVYAVKIDEHIFFLPEIELYEEIETFIESYNDLQLI